MNDPLVLVDGCVPDLRSRHDDVRAEARLQLGVHYAAQGQPEAAIRELAQVEPRENRVAAARACLRIHRLLIAEGEDAEAWDALERASELSDPRHSPDVELELAARAAALGQHDQAATRYRGVLAALTHTHRLGALAAFRLGELLCEQGLLAEASSLWRLAIRGSDEDLRPHVLARLADVLGDRPGDSEAPGLYKLVIETDHPYLAPRAALALAGLLARRDQVTAALEMYAMAISSGDTDVAEVADRHRRIIMRDRARAVVRYLHASAAVGTTGPEAASAVTPKPQRSPASCSESGCRPPVTPTDTPSLDEQLEGLARVAAVPHGCVVLALRDISEQMPDWCGLASAALIDFGGADRDAVDYVLSHAARFLPAEASSVWFQAALQPMPGFRIHAVREAEFRAALVPYEQSLIFPLYYVPRALPPAQVGRIAASESPRANTGTCTCRPPDIRATSAGLDSRPVPAGTFFVGHPDLCVRCSRFPPT